MKDKILFILGNGPSLGEIMNNDKNLELLRQHDTFGLNAAYRIYEKYNFYPTYFGCFDHVVNISHKNNFEDLVLASNPIQKFFFIGSSDKRQNLFSSRVVSNSRFQKINFINRNIESFSRISTTFSNFVNMGSSGANAAQVGIVLGYKKIVLLGCDCNYVEKINGVKIVSGSKVELTKNLSDNPNYWFPEYQQKGDRFNVPQVDKFQMLSWRNLHRTCPKNVQIINGSLQSKIPFFSKQEFKKIFP